MTSREPQLNPAHGDVRITAAMEDYLKAIYQIEQDGGPVTTQRLSEELGVSGASVTNMAKRLNDLNLLVHLPYKGVSLTDAGRVVALEVIRHHRLLELYLSQALGFEIDQVHAEADRLEHHVSEELEARMEQALGYPEFDPHGHPIPSRAGAIPTIMDIPLAELPLQTAAVVSRVSDRDQDQLRLLDGLGIRPGIEVQVMGTAPDGIPILLGNNEERVIAPDLVALIHVLPRRSATS
ncbi:MAG TPA: metal-dependent transcriptional regulator [Thermomicrobiales bacterium]|nr:metal-dependent transcriptional regulator [Thermomicrobiales bacterium]